MKRVVWVIALGVVACGGSEEPLEELYAQGLTRYVGSFFPVDDPEVDEEGVKHFRFAVPSDPTVAPRGPLCLRGTEYTVDTRTGSSDELLIWLQEGGACWGAFCAATEEASRIFEGGVLDVTPENPLANHDLVYVPYCDGSLFAGDVDRMLSPSIISPSTEGSTLSFQRGLQNLTAALDLAKREFPEPTRVVLAGSSGGAFGTIVAAPLVRFYYPDVEILVLNDSGVGVVRDQTPEFVGRLLEEFNASAVIPASCPECLARGHVTEFIGWNLDNDPNLTIGVMTHSQDAVISGLFVMELDTVFETAVLRETTALHERFPNRYKRFLLAGPNHSFLLNSGEPAPFADFATLGGLQEEVGGVRALDWVRAAVERSFEWVDTVDPALE
ncbi:MAG: pectin acetylesterase-family hydrolase [Myxococcota bacterium]